MDCDSKNSDSSAGKAENSMESVDIDEKLIREVEKHECIYNRDCGGYQKSASNKAWIAIAASIKLDEADCRRRWTNLRRGYKNALSRLRNNPKYKTPFKYVDKMSFMQYYLYENINLEPFLNSPENDLNDNNDTFEEKLIGEVKKYEYLYNTAHPEYGEDHNTWTAISTAVGAPVEQCRSSWESLLERYTKELEQSSGIDTGEYSWLYTTEMSFMKDYITQKPRESFIITDITKKDTYCRTCMCEVLKNSSISYNIFETLDLNRKLMQCSNLQIDPDDEYPYMVCMKCYEKVLDFSEFQKMCRDSLVKFDAMLQDQIQVKIEYDDEKMSDYTSNVNLPENSSLSLDPILENQTEIKIKKEKDLDGEQDTNLNSELEEKCEFGISPSLTGVESRVKEEINLDEPDGKLEQSPDNDEEDDFTFGIRQLDDDDDDDDDKSEQSSYSIDEENCLLEEQLIDEDDDKSDDSSEDEDESNANKTGKGRSVVRCDICPKAFYVQHRLIAHKRMKHEGLKGYPCSYEDCKRAFNRYTEFKRHFNSHKGIHHVFKCDIANCNVVCKSYKILRRHKEEHKSGKFMHASTSRGSNKKKEYPCRFCDRICATPNTRLYHESTHTGEKLHACEKCGERFNWPTQLNRHEKIHENETKSYSCEKCGKKFTFARSLKSHMKTHYKPKPHQCDKCGNAFSYPAALEQHKELYHTVLGI